MDTLDLPSSDLIRQQAAWLAPARAWLFQQTRLSERTSVLDLGCGHGAVSSELRELSAGRVVTLDHNPSPMLHTPAPFTGTDPACATAARLPFADNTFDLVFCQLSLLWMPLAATVAEIGRVVQPGGALVALEPDYGGMIEYPDTIATRHLWIAALQRAGADPYVGRKLPGLLAQQGFEIRVDLMSRLTAPAPERFALLRGLPLTDTETAYLDRVQTRASEMAPPWGQVIHLPFFLLSAQMQRK